MHDYLLPKQLFSSVANDKQSYNSKNLHPWEFWMCEVGKKNTIFAITVIKNLIKNRMSSERKGDCRE